MSEMRENNTVKAARLKKQPLEEGEMALINAQSLKELESGEVYAFKIAACDTKVDRDKERFSEASLAKLAALYVGRPVLMDHCWSASKQVARVYAGEVEQDGDCKRLVLRAYMPNTEDNKALIDAIDSGVIREVSVGCSVSKRSCSVCGKEYKHGWAPDCAHVPGKSYDGALCHTVLDAVTDAYELSFVAVPAQPEAGVIRKTYGASNEGWVEKVAEAVAARLQLADPTPPETPLVSDPAPDPDGTALIKSSRTLLETINY